MNVHALIQSLERFPKILVPFVESLTDEECRWSPKGTSDGHQRSWSVLEILVHLGDIETEDMRPRLRNTLEDPTRAWDPIDPEGWAIERGYAAQDVGASLTRLVRERERSLTWLRSLSSPEFGNTHDHKLGPIRAGDVMAAWAAHDWLHLRQMNKRMFQMVQSNAGEYSTEYAGTWVS